MMANRVGLASARLEIRSTSITEAHLPLARHGGLLDLLLGTI